MANPPIDFQLKDMSLPPFSFDMSLPPPDQPHVSLGAIDCDRPLCDWLLSNAGCLYLKATTRQGNDTRLAACVLGSIRL